MTLPFADRSFDAVYAHLSVHYFDDAVTRSVFAEMRRVLRPGGFLFVKCKSVDDCLYGVGEQIGPDMFRSDHTRHFFSRDYLQSMLSEFDIVSLRKSSAAYHGKRSAFVQAVATA
jgi:SAM-dependent methyltransferase